jgi:hypothetical protein
MEWESFDERPLFVKHFSPLFEDLRPHRRWFCLIDFSTSIVGAVFVAVQPRGDAGCTTLKWLNLAFSSLFLLSLLSRPFNRPFVMATYVLNYAGTLAASVLIVMGEKLGVEVLTLAQVCLTLALAVASLIFAFARRLQGLWSALRFRMEKGHFPRKNKNRKRLVLDIVDIDGLDESAMATCSNRISRRIEALVGELRRVQHHHRISGTAAQRQRGLSCVVEMVCAVRLAERLQAGVSATASK